MIKNAISFYQFDLSYNCRLTLIEGITLLVIPFTVNVSIGSFFKERLIAFFLALAVAMNNGTDTSVTIPPAITTPSCDFGFVVQPIQTLEAAEAVPMPAISRPPPNVNQAAVFSSLLFFRKSPFVKGLSGMLSWLKLVFKKASNKAAHKAFFILLFFGVRK